MYEEETARNCGRRTVGPASVDPRAPRTTAWPGTLRDRLWKKVVRNTHAFYGTNPFSGRTKAPASRDRRSQPLNGQIRVPPINHADGDLVGAAIVFKFTTQLRGSSGTVYCSRASELNKDRRVTRTCEYRRVATTSSPMAPTVAVRRCLAAISLVTTDASSHLTSPLFCARADS
jgi:hypothetical protein